MARSRRINTTGVIFHAFARGNNREPIFLDVSDYERFCENLGRYQKKFGYTIFAYCLMPNYFHLLLRPQKQPISKILQVILTAYTMYFNKKHRRVGHVFSGRFKSIILEKENYLLEVVRYIHLQPVRASMVDWSEIYPWSSYGKYFTKGSGEPPVDSSEVLVMYSEDPVKQKQLFAEFTLAGLGVDFDPMKLQTRGVLGSARFIQKMGR